MGKRVQVPLIALVLVVILSLLGASHQASAFVRPATYHHQRRLRVEQFREKNPRILKDATLSRSPRFSTTTRIHYVRDSASENNQQMQQSMVGLYIHIPYCRRRCRYCSFAIVPIGPNVSTESSTKSMEADDNLANDKEVDRSTQGFLDMDFTYREAILTEIQLLAKQQQSSSSKGPVVLQSIYFGGGTPSLAPLETIQAILDALLKPINTIDDSNNITSEPLFQLADNAEVSIEMDPGTFSISKLQALKDIGFNRISLGVQSFDDRILESIGRFHRRHHVFEAIHMIQQVFGNDSTAINYSIDLISGLPGLSLALWAETLEIATKLIPGPSHISLYDLQIESGTVFGKWYPESFADNDPNGEEGAQDALRRTRGGDVTPTALAAAAVLPPEEESAFMYKYATGYLRAKGYEHYEVSSYAYVGKDTATDTSNRSQHNQLYWAVDGQWYALGLGATSFANGLLIARPRTMVGYIEWVKQQSEHQDRHSLMDRMDLLTDVVMKRLRTSDGLNLNWIRAEYGQKYVDAVLDGASLGFELGLMIVEPERQRQSLTDSTTSMEDLKDTGGNGQTLRLTDPDGFLYSNNLISNIFVALDDCT